MPFINERFWHHHFPDFAFVLGAMMVAYYLLGYNEPDYAHGLSYGQYQMLHVAQEYYAFIALIGGLFVASGGILIDYKGKGGPVSNTMLLATGAVIANIVGTTGASVLLVRPFMRMNKGRLHAMHVVFFIFIVSNCGGCLTPIGDPPLYLGYLKGVPFLWTLEHLWPMWLACVGLLLGLFLLYDLKVGAVPQSEADAIDAARPGGLTVKGLSGIIALALIIAGVFIDPMLAKMTPAFVGIPIGPTFQIIVALTAYKIARADIHKANDFNFFPVKEVGLLFVGIFATMAPALGYLAANGDKLGVDTPTMFYFATGALSGVLDNAPTYLNFLQVAFAGKHIELTPDNVHHFLDTADGIHLLSAISLGAVFFGAMTYIGNGPNFMVRAIAEAGGLKMPSFFGYLARAVVILVPVLVVVWLLFVR
jgi:Na+/H+ antiporter NhaD/arsenite permease-like protein